MCRATENTLFVRGKHNVLDVIDVETFNYVTTLDTKN